MKRNPALITTLNPFVPPRHETCTLSEFRVRFPDYLAIDAPPDTVLTLHFNGATLSRISWDASVKVEQQGLHKPK